VGRFVADDDGAVAVLEAWEVEVLVDLARVTATLLDDPDAAPAAVAPDPGGPESADSLAAMVGIDNDAVRPDHPALARLLPDGYRDDEAAADDFRRFTQADLRAKKLADARALMRDLKVAGQDVAAPPSGAVVRLDSERSRTWLRGLNDLRLALGTSLGVSEAGDVDDDDPRLPLLQIYGWLTELQATLIDTMEPRPS